MTSALLYETLAAKRVHCFLCAHECRIKPGRRGICGVRQNTGGRLETLIYGRLVAQSADPVEKKPLFHLQPGSLSYSIATVGCNFRCRFCQNADIAQMPADHDGMIMGREVTAASVVQEAVRQDCQSIALHIYRTHRLFRIRLRHRQARPRAGLEEYLRDQRLHERPGPGHDRAISGCRQRGFKSLQR